MFVFGTHSFVSQTYALDTKNAARTQVIVSERHMALGRKELARAGSRGEDLRHVARVPKLTQKKDQKEEGNGRGGEGRMRMGMRDEDEDED